MVKIVTVIILALIVMIFNGCTLYEDEKENTTMQDIDSATDFMPAADIENSNDNECYIDVEEAKIKTQEESVYETNTETVKTDSKEHPDTNEHIWDETEMPIDFWIIFEIYTNTHMTTWDFTSMLDTKNNIIGRNFRSMYLPETMHITTEFQIPEEILREIYTKIIQHNIRKLSGYQVHYSTYIRNLAVPSSGWLRFRIRFNMNNALYTVLYSENTVSHQIPPYEEGFSGLRLLHRFLWDFYTNTEEFQNLLGE